MRDLSRCPSCAGFAPRGVSSCPHCDAALAAPDSAALRLGKKLLAAAGGGVIATTLMACYGGPPPRPTTTPTDLANNTCAQADDLDRDGQCAPVDCDDSSAAFFAGAPDPAGDGLDQDCDGADGVSSRTAK